MEVWCRNDDIVIDRLWSIGIRIWIKIQLVPVLVNARPKLTPIESEHDVPNALRLNDVLVDEVVDQVLSVRHALLHIRFLHFKIN